MLPDKSLTQRERMQFGGPWTVKKLQILEAYLDAYTTALKNKPFKLIYIDAFAGTGQIESQLEDGDTIGFLRGSTERALGIRDKPFDELIFIEKDAVRCAELAKLRGHYPERNIRIERAEANGFLNSLRKDWHACRGVLFLDPFATAVEWSTLNWIGSLNALDTWILFPVSAIVRMLPASRQPDDISRKWASRLTSVFGNESWRGLYRDDPQLTLFGESRSIRERGVDGLLRIYRENLESVFGDRFLRTSRRLVSSTGSPLFEFMFCVGNPSGIGVAKPIAKYILDKL